MWFIMKAKSNEKTSTDNCHSKTYLQFAGAFTSFSYFLSILADMKHYREKKMLFTTIEIQIRPIQPFSKSNLHFLIQYIIFIIFNQYSYSLHEKRWWLHYTEYLHLKSSGMHNCDAAGLWLSSIFITNGENSDKTFYFRLVDTPFKERYKNHTRDFKHDTYENCTELAKYIWQLKRIWSISPSNAQ